jgi:hypothetical protein
MCSVVQWLKRKIGVIKYVTKVLSFSVSWIVVLYCILQKLHTLPVPVVHFKIFYVICRLITSGKILEKLLNLVGKFYFPFILIPSLIY